MSKTSSIHRTAEIHPSAQLGDGVSVGPYAVIGGGVVIHDNVTIHSHCVLEGNTTIGRGCRIFTGAVVGSIPQDKKFRQDDETFLTIGQENVIREYVTINPGTAEGGGKTTIGGHNLLMAYSHVAHDCRVGNYCVMANSGTLAGHVTLEDHAIVGGLTAIHQFVRLGELAIVGGCSKVVQDIPPYSMCDGHPAKVYSINSVGLRRAGFSPETIKALRQAFKILFHSGLTKSHAISRLEKELPRSSQIDHLIAFVKASKRGLCDGRS